MKGDGAGRMTIAGQKHGIRVRTKFLLESNNGRYFSGNLGIDRIMILNK
jgi:hypothetical protein